MVVGWLCRPIPKRHIIAMSFHVRWLNCFVQMELRRAHDSSFKKALCLSLCLIAVAAKDSGIPFEKCGHPLFAPSSVTAQYERHKKSSQLSIQICTPRRSSLSNLWLRLLTHTVAF